MKDKAGAKKGKQYIGIALVLLAFVLSGVVINFSGQEKFASNIIMVLASAAAIMLGAVGFMTVAVVIAALSVVSFVGLTIYSLMMNSGDFSYISFLWIVIPIMAIFGISMFTSGYAKLLLDNAVLERQISELVMIDPVTGLYNLRSMYMDIQTQISYCERNNSPISLMIIRLRYPAEMRKVLKPAEYDNVIKQLSLLLIDTVRLEDKVYNIDGDGGFGIILTCNKDGTKIVEKRLRGKLEDPKWFEGISKNKIRAEVKIGYMQYDKEKFNRDANSFKESVEEEVDYDI